MEKKKISIIVPNYNHAAFLKQRLTSIFNQTYQNYEVILLDDASTDDSISILKSYANFQKVSHFIINTKNSGSPFSQWQKGIGLAKGEFIWIAESDDYCETNFLKKMVGQFRKNVVLSYCASNNVDENGKTIGRNNWAGGLDKKRWSKDYINEGKDEVRHFLRFRNTIPNASAVVFRKEAIHKVKIPNEMQFCGDWYIWMEILKKGDVAYITEPLNFFRRHKNSTRVIKEIDNERKKFNEYFYLIKTNSSLLERIRYIERYDWILVELEYKSQTFNKADNKIELPVELQVRNWLRNKKI